MNVIDAFDMGKYAPYVWGSYGVVAAALILEVVFLRRRRRTIIKQLSRMMRITSNKAREQTNETKT